MFSVIIPMAGKGTRVKREKNKALLEINGKPMFLYSYNTFKKFDCEIILVVSHVDYDEVKKYVSNDRDTILAIGGDTRAESVYQGLKKCTKEYVLIHDAARPLVTEDIIKNVIDNLYDNAVLVATKVKDTIRDNGEVLVRDNLLAAQTPQACRVNDLIFAYEIALKGQEEITDDISVIQKYTNLNIKIVEGNDLNYKITTSVDLMLAEILSKGDVIND